MEAPQSRLPSAPASAPPLPVVYELPSHWRQPLLRARERWYLPVSSKYACALLVGGLWMAFSLWLAKPWAAQLAEHVGAFLSWSVIAGIALLPGFMNAFLATSLLLDRRPPHQKLAAYPGLTILIAAYNEERTIVDTIRSLAQQHYPGRLQVIVINDGSTDHTAELVREQQAEHSWLQMIDFPHNHGKAHALNAGLKLAAHNLVITVDADSWLFKHALTHIVERYAQDPVHTRAVAGAVKVRNSRDNWLTRMQEFDYFHGIASIKRVQSLYQATMVAQGAFSLYDREALIEVGGWPPCVGEDIVLTWALIKRGYRIGYCEDALLFTKVPTTLGRFFRQRLRWARGLIEALKHHPTILLRPRLSLTFVYWNLLFPFLDFVFTAAFVPGIVLALFGHYWIVGPITLVLIPMAMAINLLMFYIGRRLFCEVGLKIRFNVTGFINYSLFYGLLMQPVSLCGYAAELLNRKKRW